MSRTVEAVYDFIYGLIAGGSLRPGSRLTEESIAEQLGVSRTPVREAIRRLGSEGLLVLARNSGAEIVSLSGEEVGEIFHLRAMLEGYAAERAASRISAEQLVQLEALNAGMAAEFAGGNAPDQLIVARLNTRFHLTIAEAAQSRPLVGQIRALVNLPLALMHEAPGSGDARPVGWAAKLARSSGTEEQAEIIAALRAGDPELARARMTLHVLHGRPAGRPAGQPAGEHAGKTSSAVRPFPGTPGRTILEGGKARANVPRLGR